MFSFRATGCCVLSEPEEIALFVLNVKRYSFSKRKNLMIGLSIGLLVLIVTFLIYFGFKNNNLAQLRSRRMGLAFTRLFHTVVNDVRGNIVDDINAKQVKGTLQIRVTWKRVKGIKRKQEIFRANQPLYSRIDLEKVGIKVGEVDSDREQFTDTVLRRGDYYYAVVIRNELNQFPLVIGRNSTANAVTVAFPGVVHELRSSLQDTSGSGEQAKVLLTWKLPPTAPKQMVVYRSTRIIRNREELDKAVQVKEIATGQQQAGDDKQVVGHRHASLKDTGVRVVRIVDTPARDGHYFYAVLGKQGKPAFLAGDNYTDLPVTIGNPEGKPDTLPKEGMPFTLSLSKTQGGEDEGGTDQVASEDDKLEQVTRQKVVEAIRPIVQSVLSAHPGLFREVTFYYGYEYLFSSDSAKAAGQRPSEKSVDFSIISRLYRNNQINYELTKDKEGHPLLQLQAGLTAEAQQGYSLEVEMNAARAKGVWGLLFLLLILGFVTVLLIYVYDRFVGKASLVVSLILLILFAGLGLRLLSQDVISQMRKNNEAITGFYSTLVKAVQSNPVYADAKGPYLQYLAQQLTVNSFNEPVEKLAASDGLIKVGADGRISYAREWVNEQEGAVFVFILIMTGVVLVISIPLTIASSRGLVQRFINAVINHRTAYAFTIPAIVLLILLVFAPLLYTFLLSTTYIPRDMHIIEIDIGRQFVGLRNFGNLLGVFDLTDINNFYWTLKTTIIYTLVTVIMQTTLGIALAMLLNMKKLRFRTTFRTLLILPWAIPTYVSALIWRYLFDSGRVGFINQIVYLFGEHPPINWIYDPTLGLLVIILASIWYGFPFIMVVALGALQSIPADLYESATIDGASAFDRTFYITLPMIQPAVMPAIILSTLWTFNNFNFVYLVNNAYNGTDILVTRIYDFFNSDNIQNIDYAVGATFSTVIFFILLIYVYVLRRFTNFTEKSF